MMGGVDLNTECVSTESQKTRVCLKEVRLINCQAYEDVTIPLADDKLNVLVANNSVGKSIFFKMLDVTACPEKFDAEDRKNIIRHGKDYAQVMFSFSDGVIAAVRVLASRVIYFYKAAGESIFYAYESAPDSLLEHLGLLVDKREGFIANIMDSDHDLLLVDSKERSNHNALRMITENAQLSGLQELLDRKAAEAAELKLKVEDRFSSITQQMKGYRYVDESALQDNIDSCELLFRMVCVLSDAEVHLHNIMFFTRDTKNYDSLIEETELYQKIQDAAQILMRYKTPSGFNEKALWVVELCEKIQALRDTALGYKKPRRFNENTFVVCDILSELSKANAGLTPIPDSPNYNALAEIFNIYSKADRVRRAMQEYCRRHKSCIKSSDAISDIVGYLKENNTVHHCEIYGEVLYDGETCIPVNL